MQFQLKISKENKNAEHCRNALDCCLYCITLNLCLSLEMTEYQG